MSFTEPPITVVPMISMGSGTIGPSTTTPGTRSDNAVLTIKFSLRAKAREMKYLQ